MMLVVVAYDVNTESAAGKRRLRRVAKICEGYGQRVQNSVFECWLNTALLVLFRSKLLAETDRETDSLRRILPGRQLERSDRTLRLETLPMIPTDPLSSSPHREPLAHIPASQPFPREY